MTASIITCTHAATNSWTSTVVTAGDLILIHAYQGSTVATITASDNSSGGTNTYNQLGTGIYNAGGTTSLYVFYAVAKAAETLAITTTILGGGNDYGGYVTIIRGLNQTLSAVLDGYWISNDTTSSTSHTNAAGLTTYANDFGIASWFDNQGQTFTNGTGGYTQQINSGGEGIYYKSVSATGTYPHTISYGTANNQTSGHIVYFKLASATTYQPYWMMFT